MAVRTPRVPHDTPMWEDPPNNTRMSRTWVIFLERLGQREEIAAADTDLKATFGLVRELTVEDDLTLHFICRRPGRFVGLLVNGKLPARGSAARIQIERFRFSDDDENPATANEWVNIFLDRTVEEVTTPGYIELGDADELEIEPGAPYVEVFNHFVTPIFKEGADGTIQAGDLLRINCTQVGSTYPGKGYEIVLAWEPE